MRDDATTETSTLEGMMLLYVDDIFMPAPTKNIQSTLTAIQNKWKMTITGIISRDDVTPEKPVTEINVLGCRVTAGEDNTIRLEQHGYIQEKLRDRDYSGTFGKTGLPTDIHKKLEPVPKEERQTTEFLEYRKLCQEECGVLLWIGGYTT